MNAMQVDFYEKIKGYVLRKVRDRQDAEDIVQDVFVKVQLNQHQLRDTEKLLGWVYRITHHAITDYYRLRKKETTGFVVDTPNDHHVFNECVEQCLDKLSGQLPSPYKEAIQLSEKENISQLELAHRWGISHSGAKSRVQRARLMLKEKMLALYNIKTDVYGNVIFCEGRVPCGCSSYETVIELNKQ